MKKSLKYMIITRVLLVVVVILSSFAALSYISLQNISETNIFRQYHDRASEVFSKLNTTLENVYQMSSSLSANKEVQDFLDKEKFNRPADQVKEITELMHSLQNITILQPYMHSFCIVDNQQNVYWSKSPFDNYFMQWLEKHVLNGKELKEFSGFLPAYKFPGTSQTQTSTLISCITDIYEVDGGKLRTDGKIIMNVDADVLIKDILGDSRYLEGIEIRDKNGDLFYRYVKRSRDDNFLPKNYVYGMRDIQKIKDSYYLEKELEAVEWKGILKFQSIPGNLFEDTVFLKASLVIAIVGIGMMLILVIPLLNRISRQIKALETAMHEFAEGNMDASLELKGISEMENISRGFHYMEVKSKQFMKEALNNEKAKQQVSFELILAKINPHFIYNTLNSVIYLARQKKYESVIQLTSSFIYLLQDSIHLERNSMFESLETEFEVINHYILIQKFRYMDMFSFQSEKETGLDKILIPKNILQPLIENSILHGICPVEDGRECKIKLTAKKIKDILELEILDNGVGFDKMRFEQICRTREGRDTGNTRSKIRPIGIRNIAEKLEMIYGDRHFMTVESKEMKGTIIKIGIPIIYENKEQNIKEEIENEANVF